MDAVTYDSDADPRTTYDGDNDRRTRPRVMVSVPYQLYGADGQLLLRARTLDLSTHGALLHGSCGLSIGDHVQLELMRGEARNPLKLRAEVVRLAEPAANRRHHGIGVQFQDISALDETILKSVIADARV